jgi:hypothetical protein
MPVVFFLSKKREGIRSEDYEKWVREFDYVITQRMKSVTFYRVNRIKEKFQGDPPYDYIEYIQITNYDEYRKEFDGPIGKEILAQWTKYVLHADAVYAETIEP